MASSASLDSETKVEPESPATLSSEHGFPSHTADGKAPASDVEKQTATTSWTGPPDGGREAWLCVLGGTLALFCSFGWINCIGVFQEYYQTHTLRGYSASTISWIASLQVFLMFFPGPIWGWIFDCYGPRWLLATGSFLQVFALMMLSLCTEYYQFILAQGICSPLGSSMIFYAAMPAVSGWFNKKRGTALGIIASGSSFAGVVLPIMTQRLIDEVGFGWSVRSVAFLMLALLLVANFTIKIKIPLKPKPFRPVAFFRPFKELPYVLTAFASILFFLGLFLPINYIIVEAISRGMKPGLAQYLVSILNAASFFGRTLPGLLADKIGRYNMMIIMDIFSAVICLALWIPAKTAAPIIVFAALYGFGSGAFVSLGPACVAQISDVREIGVRTGMLYSVVSFAGLVSNPVGGAILARWNGEFTGVQIFAGVVMMAGGVVFTITRIRLVGRKLTAKV